MPPIPLPFLPVNTLNTSRDSIIKPVKEPAIPKKRWQHGWIFGVNANAVDYQPLRLSILPHMGYFVNYHLKPGIEIQGEFVAKLVSGYRLHAEFVDIVPGGSSHIILNTNHLLFLEAPILLKHTYKPRQSWLLGFKPSGVIAIASTGLSSSSGYAPFRFVDDQIGIRHFDFGLVFGWEWRFSKRWALDMRYNQGLFDLTFDPFYQDTKTHLNSDLQVSLRYFIDK